MSSKSDLQQLAGALERRTGTTFRLYHRGGRWGVEAGSICWEDKTKRGLRCYLEGALDILGGAR